MCAKGIITERNFTCGHKYSQSLHSLRYHSYCFWLLLFHYRLSSLNFKRRKRVNLWLTQMEHKLSPFAPDFAPTKHTNPKGYWAKLQIALANARVSNLESWMRRVKVT